MKVVIKEAYLGDGLYVAMTPQGIRLRASRLVGDHVVFLDEQTLDQFLLWLRDVRKTLLKRGVMQ